MRRRTGYLHKRGKGWYVTFRVNGKSICRSLRDEHGLPITTKREAGEAREKLMEPFRVSDEVSALESIAGKLEGRKAELAKLDAQQNPPLSFTQAWSAFMNSEKRKEDIKACNEVLVNYERQFEHFTKWVAENHPDVRALNQVTLPMAKSYRMHLAMSGRTPNTVNKYLAALAMVWRILSEEAQLKDQQNPWVYEVVGREDEPEDDQVGRKPFTKDEVRKICERATGDMQKLFSLAAMTALRLKDCCLLRWSEVTLNHDGTGEITRVPAKTKRFGVKVTIPMPPPLWRILSSLAHDKSGYVFPALAERYQANKRELISAIQDHIESCGISTRGEAADGRRAPTVRGFHSFRHFFASDALQRTSMLNVRKMLGHSSQWMTDKYSHILDQEEQRKAVGLLADSIDIESTKSTPVLDAVALRARVKQIAESMTAKNWRKKRALLLSVVA